MIVAGGSCRESVFTEPDTVRFALRMFGIPVRVHPTFWLFSWGFSYFYRPAPNLPWQYVFLFIGVMFFAVLWHEMGHALTGQLFGYRGQIVLFGMGGAAVGEYDQARRWQRILIALSGPAAGFTLWYLTSLFKFDLLPRIDPAKRYPALTRGVDLMLFETFLWNTMNLLPVLPLDGGQVLRESVTGIFRKKGYILALLLSIAFAVLIALYSKDMIDWAANRWADFWYLKHLSPLVTMIFFFLFAAQSGFALIGGADAQEKVGRAGGRGRVRRVFAGGRLLTRVRRTFLVCVLRFFGVSGTVRPAGRVHADRVDGGDPSLARNGRISACSHRRVSDPISFRVLLFLRGRLLAGRVGPRPLSPGGAFAGLRVRAAGIGVSRHRYFQRHALVVVGARGAAAGRDWAADSVARTLKVDAPRRLMGVNQFVMIHQRKIFPVEECPCSAPK